MKEFVCDSFYIPNEAWEKIKQSLKKTLQTARAKKVHVYKAKTLLQISRPSTASKTQRGKRNDRDHRL